tara:strand:+ start:2210 stop:3196 length:987 start_codon:yes stop_codon:yes gene_type:complete
MGIIKNMEANINKKILLKTMMRIRAVEEKIAKEYSQQKMRCPTHLSIGQEAVPSAISMCINKNDFVVSTHRGHAHYLAKGGDLKAMIAEIYGKETGCSKGKGGSMHLIDTKVGFMGTSAIVGNSIPVGVGLALSSKLKKSDQISVVYLGDGAVEEGVFYESLNFAILQELRVLFVCENNLYSVYSSLDVRQPKDRKIVSIAKGIGAKAEQGDGNDIEECVKVGTHAINTIRSEGGPFFLEFATYRHREHCGPNFDNEIGYRTLKEFEIWKLKDPISNYQNRLLKQGICCKKDFQYFAEEIDHEIEDAFKFADNSNFPLKSEAFKGVYS